MTVPAEPMPDDDSLEDLRRRLDAGTPYRRFPPALEARFDVYARERALRLTRDSLPVAVPAFLLVALLLRWLVIRQSDAAFLAGNLRVLDRTMLCEAAVVGFLMLTPYLPNLPRYFRLYGSLTTAAGLGIITVAASAFPEPRLNIGASYLSTLVIALTYAVSGLGLRNTAWASSAGLAAALGVILWQGWWLDGGYFLIYAVLANLVGMLISLLLEVRDRVSFLQSCLLDAEKLRLDAYAAEVSRLARVDALTGLANRRHFNEALQREWGQARRLDQPLGLIFIDVDDFKPYNDSYGHPAGDAVLAALGQVLGGLAKRPADLAARYGGEEFVVLLPQTPLEGVLELAERIRDAVAGLALPHGAARDGRDRVTVSLGIAARIPEGDDSEEVLLAAADGALYRAKGNGRDRVEAG